MLVVMGALAMALQAGQPADPIDTVKIAAAMSADMQRTRAPGAAIGIIIDGKVVFARGFGTRSAERSDAVEAGTLFRIGSVTKVLTALTALRSEQAGRVSLAQAIGTYYPALHASLKPLTLRQLLTHKAGMIALPSADGPSDEGALARRVAAWTDTVLFAKPDEVYSYSSPGYWLVGAVIEQAEQARYSELVQRYVFEPLGMTTSTFDPLVALTRPLALDHRRNPQGAVTVVRPYPNDASTWPGGSAFASIHDLARLATALLNGGSVHDQRALPVAVVNAVMTKQTDNPASGCGYTFGLGFCEAGRDTIISHYGFRSGSGAVFTLVPTKRAAIIILANSGGAIFGQTERVVLDLLGVAREPAGQPKLREIARKDFTKFAGTYVAGSDSLRITEVNAQLVLQAGGESQVLRVAGPNELFAVDQEGNPVARFVLLQSARGNAFLSDGLNAFRRASSSMR
jgi:CubicO group peptidase (beta-lactamase class C family)